MGKNNPNKKIFKKNLVGLILVGSLLSPFSCNFGYEIDEEDSELDESKKHIYVSSGVYIIHEGDSVRKIVNVLSNREYELSIFESNDGPQDTISVYADDVKIGEHLSPDEAHGGDGWYLPEYSPKAKFISSSSRVEVGVHVDKADSYGYWPNGFRLEIVE